MGWIGVDLDGTLAEWGPGTSNPGNFMIIGDPIPLMVDRVRAWLADGRDVRIFTARVGPATVAECQVYDFLTWEDCIAYQRLLIEAWCVQHLGQVLPITATKDFHMFELWDDRCQQVEPNTGRHVLEIVAEIVATPPETV